MGDSQSVDFKRLFELSPQLCLVLDTRFNIVAVSNTYLAATMTVREEILGRNIFDVFPGNPDLNVDGFSGQQNLRMSLELVLEQKLPHTMAVQKYDIRKTEHDDFEERFWSPINSPIMGDDGQVLYILHRVEDVTEFVLLKQSGTAHNQLTGELQERVQSMEGEIYLRAQEIQERTKDLEKANKDLVKARDEAVKISGYKSEFLANMSHEIRTPMNGILGMAEIILGTDISPKMRNYVSVIRDAGKSLLDVINDILDFSKIESGKLTFEIVDFEPVKLVEDLATLLTEQAHNRDLSLVTHIDPSLPPVLRGDPVRLRQVLINLAGNAIKFSDRGEVLVKVDLIESSAEQATIRFAVVDQGIGLSDQDISKLFQPFVQVDGSMTRKHGGTGLGLSISQKFVEMMGGKLAVESVKDKGATFAFTVDLPIGHGLADEKAGIKTDLRGIKVLVVDDEAHARNVLVDYLSSWGMVTVQAQSGPDALSLMRSAQAQGESFDLAILDLVMPNMSGLELGRVIFDDIKLCGTKLILFTANDKPGLSSEALGLGFKDFLTKPVKRSRLLDCVAGVLLSSQIDVSHDEPDLYEGGTASGANAVVQRDELILVVDDHPVNQKIAILLLRNLGLEAHVAENGRAALESIELTNYSLIFMDVQMPEMNGYEATRHLRNIESRSGKKRVPVVAMTAHALEGSRATCIGAGMDDYISKPIDPNALKTILDKWLPPLRKRSPAAISGSHKVADSAPIDFDLFSERYGEENIQIFLDVFLQDAPGRMSLLEDALASRDKQAVLEVAHSLKGGLSGVFATQMVATCVAIEDSVRDSGVTATAMELFGKLSKEFHDLKNYLKATEPSQWG